MVIDVLGNERSMLTNLKLKDFFTKKEIFWEIKNKDGLQIEDTLKSIFGDADLQELKICWVPLLW